MNHIFTGYKSDDATIRKGSYVCVEVGSYKGKYGTVEYFNDDLSHVSVKLNLSKAIIDLPYGLLRVVGKKEFDQESRVINKSQYDQYSERSSNSSHNETV